MSKKNHTKHLLMRNPSELRSRHYAAHMIKLNEYLAIFPGSNPTKRTVKTDRNYILLHSMPNGRIIQMFLHGFGFEMMPFKNEINMLESMEIAE